MLLCTPAIDVPNYAVTHTIVLEINRVGEISVVITCPDAVVLVGWNKDKSAITQAAIFGESPCNRGCKLHCPNTIL